VAHRILICDDAIFMRTMIADILTGAGYEIAGEAESGLQAVERYKALKPDLVTMDIVMPDMGGIDAVKAIIAVDPEARILMCSAMGQQQLVVEAVQARRNSWSSRSSRPACLKR
jgi:two-component system chemotaxis response regulator CheY